MLPFHNFLSAAVDHCLSSPCKNGATCTRRVETYACKCSPGFHGHNCDKGTSAAGTSLRKRCRFSLIQVAVSVFVSTQHVPPPTAAASGMAGANIFARSFQTALMCVSALRDIDWTGTTAAACHKVRALSSLSSTETFNTRLNSDLSLWSSESGLWTSSDDVFPQGN